MEKRLEKVLEQNGKMSTEFKELTHQALDNIFNTLNSKNFLKWLSRSKLSDKIKELIVEEFLPEDYEKENVTGYFRESENAIRLRLDRNRQNDKYTLSDRERKVHEHELFHFMTNDNSFPTFFDEGLTEYMKYLVEGGPVSYYENVETIKYLHNLIGDSLIKVYLMADEKEIESMKTKIAKLAGFETEQKQRDFYDAFDKIHNKLHNKESADLNIDKDIELASNALENMAANRIIQKLNNLEYYKDGKIDFIQIRNEASELIKSIPNFNLYSSRGRLSLEDLIIAETDAITRIMEKALDSSTILIGLSPEAKKKTKEELMKAFSFTVTSDDLTVTTIPGEIDLNNPIFKIPSSIKEKIDVGLHILNDAKEIPEFMEKLQTISSKLDFSEEMVELLLNTAILNNFGSSKGAKEILQAIKSNPKIQHLLEIRKQDEENIVTRKFVKIEEPKFLYGQDLYIEQRDNQLFITKISNNNNEMSSSQIFNEKSSVEASDYGINIYEHDDFRGKFEIIAKDFDINRAYVQKKGIDNKKIIIGPAYTIDEMIQDEIIRTILKSDIYISKADDGSFKPSVKASYSVPVDDRSYEMKFDKLVEDIRELSENFPILKEKHSVTTIVEKLLTSGIVNEENSSNQEKYQEVQSMANLIGTISTQEKINTEVVYNLYKDLNDILTAFNIKHKKYIEEKSKEAMVFFESEEDSKEYFRQLREYYEVQESQEKAKSRNEWFSKRIKMISEQSNYVSYDDSKYPVDIASNLKGLKPACVRQESDATIDYDSIKKNIMELFETFEGENKEQILNATVDTVFDNLLTKVFLFENEYLDDYKEKSDMTPEEIEEADEYEEFYMEDGVRSAVENLREMFHEYVEQNKEMDLEELDKITETLNSQRNFTVRRNKSRISGITTYNKNSRKALQIIRKMSVEQRIN